MFELSVADSVQKMRRNGRHPESRMRTVGLWRIGTARGKDNHVEGIQGIRERQAQVLLEQARDARLSEGL